MLYTNKIRLFINVELPSWQTIVHLTTCSRLHSGKWWDYHIYKVKHFDNDGILHLVSYSSIENLKKMGYNNNGIYDKYYCYYGYNRCEIYENQNYLLTKVKIHGSLNPENNIDYSPFIKVPNIITNGDRIIIYNPNNYKETNPITELLDINNKPELV
jgi:hypothetical protein